MSENSAYLIVEGVNLKRDLESEWGQWEWEKHSSCLSLTLIAPSLTQGHAWLAPRTNGRNDQCKYTFFVKVVIKRGAQYNKIGNKIILKNKINR